MKIGFRRNYSVSFEQDVIDKINQSLVDIEFVGSDNEYLYFFDSEIEKLQQQHFEDVIQLED